MKALFLIALSAIAQNPPQPKLSISGMVHDVATGLPAEADVAVSQRVNTQTDAQGHYTLRDLDPGRYRITVTGRGLNGTRMFGASVAKSVTLANQDLTSVDFELRPDGSISGKITDQNDQPVTDLSVMLVAREYRLGALRYVFASSAKTNDAGEYTLRRVAPNRGFLVLAERRTHNLDGLSISPLDPKLRRPAFVPTFYPGSTAVEGAQVLMLRPGEHRESIDIRVRRSPSYCIDGEVQSGSGGAKMDFAIQPKQPSNGASGNGAMYVGAPGGTPGPDGKIRVCELSPGEYSLSAEQVTEASQPSTFYGATPVSITDSDLHRIFVPVFSRIKISGVVVWLGNLPQVPVTSRLNIFFESITRTDRANVTTGIPGEFSWEPQIDEYSVRILGIPAGVYVKDILFGNHSTLHEPIRPGTTAGDATLRIVLAADGGKVNAKVTAKDGNPVDDQYVLIAPAAAATEAAFAAGIVSAQTDQNGTCTSPSLEPGKYIAVATTEPLDMTPETIERFWRSRARFQEIELTANAVANVTLIAEPFE